MTEKKYCKLVFAQGTVDLLAQEHDFEKKLDIIKEKIREFFNLKNVNFLFDSGASNGAIPTMSQLYENLTFLIQKKLKNEFQIIAKKVGNNFEQC